MKRKYISEFALHTYTSQVTIAYPNYLKDPAINEMAYNHNIYMIVMIPKLTIEKNSIELHEDYISMNIIISTNEKREVKNIKYDLSHHVQRKVNHKLINYEIDNPGKGITIFNHKKEEVGFISVLVLYHYEWYIANIMYVGEAFGKNGERKAPQRLKSHSTLQKIQSDILYEEPKEDIAIVLLEFATQRMVSFDGRSKDYEKSQTEDNSHLNRVIGNELYWKQIINITEAALIHYFKPDYNDKFKNNFPKKSHTGYQQYYDLDYNALRVEIDTTAIKVNFHSDMNVYDFRKSISYELHPQKKKEKVCLIFLNS